MEFDQIWKHAVHVSYRIYGEVDEDRVVECASYIFDARHVQVTRDTQGTVVDVNTSLRSIHLVQGRSMTLLAALSTGGLKTPVRVMSIAGDGRWRPAFFCTVEGCERVSRKGLLACEVHKHSHRVEWPLCVLGCGVECDRWAAATDDAALCSLHHEERYARLVRRLGLTEGWLNHRGQLGLEFLGRVADSPTGHLVRTEGAMLRHCIDTERHLVNRAMEYVAPDAPTYLIESHDPDRVPLGALVASLVPNMVAFDGRATPTTCIRMKRSGDRVHALLMKGNRVLTEPLVTWRNAAASDEDLITALGALMAFGELETLKRLGVTESHSGWREQSWANMAPEQAPYYRNKAVNAVLELELERARSGCSSDRQADIEVERMRAEQLRAFRQGRIGFV